MLSLQLPNASVVGPLRDPGPGFEQLRRAIEDQESLFAFGIVFELALGLLEPIANRRIWNQVGRPLGVAENDFNYRASARPRYLPQLFVVLQTRSRLRVKYNRSVAFRTAWGVPPQGHARDLGNIAVAGSATTRRRAGF
jgi:hypothetical protein